MAGNRAIYEESMNAGHNAAWDQEWAEAIQAYGRAVTEFPDDPEAHNHLGLALLEAGRLDDALKVYTRAHQLAPFDPIPLEKSADILERLGRLREAAQQYVNVAEVYFGQRDLDKAISNWERATKLTPGLVPVHGKLAQVRERIGDSRGAVREYLILAFQFQRLGETDKAMRAAQRAMRLEPRDPQVLNTIRALEAGHTLSMPRDEGNGTGRVEAQADVFDTPSKRRGKEQASEVNPLGPMGDAMTTALGMLAAHVMEHGMLDANASAALQAMELQRQGLRQEAINAYRKAANTLRHPALKLNLGALLVLENRHEEAIPALRDAIQSSALEAGAYHGLGQAHFKLERYLQAAKFLIQALRVVDADLAADSDEVENLESVYDRLLPLIESRNAESLAAINRRFLKLLEGKDWKQRIAETRRQIEETIREQGEEGAVEVLIASRGDELTDSVARIDSYMRQGLLTLAMDEAHRAVELSPHYLPVHVRMADIMMREGRLRNAITKYNAVARTYMVRGENDRAAAMLSEVLEMAPLDISVRQNLIELLQEEQRWNDVIDQYTQLADTYNQLGNFDQARETFSLAERTARRVNAPTELLVRIKHRIADIDQMRLDTRRAQKTFEEIIELSPDDERAHRMLIDIHYRQGNPLEGLRRLDQLLGVYARNKQITKIVKLLEELVKQYPKDTGLRSRLAAIYRQLGRNREAIAQLDALGEMQLEAGQQQDAINTIRQIISLNPDNVDAYRRLLAQLGGG